ncbi:hypothetical protein [Paenibacillus paridis]|uniref:hypothetical protein n=1 Tax=Paenibacillus paridis TaxID=2583376 RepID=UPI001120D0DB|nr:hypothetical protein [Paenibacillus paridis]
MSTNLRSIRGIERTHAYVPVQAVSPYTSYPYRDGEVQQVFEDETEWSRIYQQAANSAAAWISSSKQAQSELEQLTWKLGRELHEGKPITDSLNRFTTLLNKQETIYKQHADDLKPELWESVELALRHPAAQELGLRRSTSDGTWVMDSKHVIAREDGTPSNQLSPAASDRMKRLLLGADGLLNDLKYALAYGDEQSTFDLLQPQLTSTLPYAAYFGSMQTYSPIPYIGLVLNRYL